MDTQTLEYIELLAELFEAEHDDDLDIDFDGEDC